MRTVNGASHSSARYAARSGSASATIETVPPIRRTAAACHLPIIGAGMMGKWHADAVRRIGGTVSIVADADPDRAAYLAEECDAPFTVRIGDALSRQIADVAHVTTPAEEHVYAIRAALESGLHVLAEKPLAPSAAVTAELFSI